MTAILVILTIIVAVSIDAALVAWRKSHAPSRAFEPAPMAPMKAPAPPQGVFLDSAHTWLRITSDGRLRIGLDDLLSEAVGEVDSVGTPPPGTSVKRGEPLLRLSVRGRTIVVPSPASGEVMSLNERALTDPRSLTHDPYGSGWIVSLFTRDHHEAIRPLKIGPAAAAYLRHEFQRFADFLTRQAAPVPVLADGGVTARGAVTTLGDAAFGAFVEEFLDNGKEA